MRALFLAIVLMVAAQEVSAQTAVPTQPATVSPVVAPAVQWNPSWRYCRRETDCSVIRDECLNWTGIATLAKQQGERYYYEKRKTAKCAEPFYLPQPKAVCNQVTQGCEVTY